MSRPTCKGCRAIIRWITTEAGAHMPADPEEVVEYIDTDAPTTLQPRVTLITAAGQLVTGHRGTVLTPGARAPSRATCPIRRRARRPRSSSDDRRDLAPVRRVRPSLAHGRHLCLRRAALAGPHRKRYRCAMAVRLPLPRTTEGGVVP